MYGLGVPLPLLAFPSNSSQTLPFQSNLPSISQSLRLHPPNLHKTKQFQLYAETKDQLPPESDEEGNKKEEGVRFNFKWANLLLDPNPDNIVAVGLTGLLTWASVQVLWQLFVISAAILLAALKYTLVAALLVFILITLL